MRVKRVLPAASFFLVRVAGAAALALSLAVPAAAQEWTEYQNIQDGFKIVFPGQPKVMMSRSSGISRRRGPGCAAGS